MVGCVCVGVGWGAKEIIYCSRGWSLSLEGKWVFGKCVCGGGSKSTDYSDFIPTPVDLTF